MVPAARAEEDRGGDVVARHGEGAFALAASCQGGGGDEWGGNPGSGVVGDGRGVPGVGACAEEVAQEGEGEFDCEVLEGAPCVVCAAPGEEGVVHGDMAGGRLRVGLHGDLGEALRARGEDGVRVGQDAVVGL